MADSSRLPLAVGLRRLAADAFSWFCPPVCACCHAALGPCAGDFLCAECRDGLQVVEWPQCPCAAGPRPSDAHDGCPFCKPLPDAFRSARAAFPYAGVAGQVVRNMKYRRGPHLADALARLALARLGGWIDRLKADGRVDIVLGAPIHPLRRLRRGFNQADALAEAIGRLAGLPVGDRIIARVANPRAQARRPDRAARLESVRDAFAVIDPPRIAGLGVLLVDDVMTTGATLACCAAALKSAGAREAHLLAIATAGPFPRAQAPADMRQPEEREEAGV